MGLFNYLKKDIWNVRLEDLPRKKAIKIRIYRVLMLIAQGFSKWQVQQGASALTYYTLLAIVPVLAFLFRITKNLLLQDGFSKWLDTQFAGQQLVVQRLIQYAQLTLKQTDKGILTGIGILLVLWSGIRILLYIEFIMNHIWEVREKRSWAKRFTDYMAVIGFCPALLAISIVTTAYVSTAITDIRKETGVLDLLGPVLFPLLHFLPVAISWLFLTFLYVFIPNTYVRLLPAFYAAVIAGSIYQVISWFYFYLQIGVSRYNAIYGTFAALPLFLIWVHLSWIIVLVGANIAFAFQNVKACEFGSSDSKISHYMHRLLTLCIAHFCIKMFAESKPAKTALEISDKLNIPLRLTKEILYQLVEAGVLLEVAQVGERMNAFAPAIPEDLLTIKRVIDMIECHGDRIPLMESSEREQIIKSLEAFSELIEKSDQNRLLKEIR